MLSTLITFAAFDYGNFRKIRHFHTPTALVHFVPASCPFVSCIDLPLCSLRSITFNRSCIDLLSCFFFGSWLRSAGLGFGIGCSCCCGRAALLSPALTYRQEPKSKHASTFGFGTSQACTSSSAFGSLEPWLVLWFLSWLNGGLFLGFGFVLGWFLA